MPLSNQCETYLQCFKPDKCTCHLLSVLSFHQQNKERIFSIGEKNSLCQKKDSRGEEKDIEGHGTFNEC